MLGTRIALFADNSPRWLIADRGIMSIGAFNAVRSSQAETQELFSKLARRLTTIENGLLT
jgi:long-chain acyl-CoA synthetase